MLLAFACSGPAGSTDAPVDSSPPAESCDPAVPAAWDSSRTYSERTSEWGLDGIRGTRLATADLDGDGYPDLLLTDSTPNVRDDLDADARYHFLMLNRPGADGGRTFVDATVESGILANRDGGVGTSHTLYAAGDVDNDGDLDVFAGRYYDAGAADATGDCSELYLNDGTAHFTRAPASDLCIPEGYPTASAAFTDYDADGILDLWVVGWYVEYGQYTGAQDHLYRGNGDGTFTDVTEAQGLGLRAGRTDYSARDVRRPAQGAAACDVNGDARPDLLATNYGRSWNQLWRNDGGSFVEIGEASGFASDDDLDYSDNAFYSCWCQVYGGCKPEPTVGCASSSYASYWSPGVDDQPWRLAGNSFTTVCADLDNDGDNDLYTTEIVHDWAGGSADPSGILRNDGTGRFDRLVPGDIGMGRSRPRTGWNEGDLYAAAFDFDNDGWKDILLASSDYEDTHLWHWRQVSPGQYEEVGARSGLDQPWPAGLAVADFDRDGDLDVLTGSSTARSGTPWKDHRVHLYESGLGASNWVQIAGLPIGTRVEVEAGGVVQTQEVVGAYGVASIQNDLVLHFGLGAACAIDHITATYPGGRTDTWQGKAGNRLQTLTPSR